MKQYQIFAIIIITFFVTVFAVNQVHKRDHNKEIEKINLIHKHETDTLKMEIAELNECLFLKNGLNL